PNTRSSSLVLSLRGVRSCVFLLPHSLSFPSLFFVPLKKNKTKNRKKLYIIILKTSPQSKERRQQKKTMANKEMKDKIDNLDIQVRSMSEAMERRLGSLDKGQGNTNAAVARLEQRLDEILRGLQLQRRGRDERSPSPRRQERRARERRKEERRGGEFEREDDYDQRYQAMRPGEKEGCTWDRLKELIREKYYPTYYRAEMERQFLSLQQGTRSVDEYEREFTRLAAFVPDLVRTEAQRAQRFIDRLYPAVRHNIVGHGTQTYARAVSIAQEVDASIRREASRDRSQPSAPAQSSTAPPALPAAQPTRDNKRKGKVVKQLTPEEIKRQHEKGLCFRCEEKFMPGHRCKQAFVIEVVNSDNKEAEVEEEPEPMDDIEAFDEEAEISMHAVAGIRGPRTMRLPAWVKDQRVIVLVDNGSSHNFINADLSQKLNLPTTRIEPFEVRVANGERLQCTESFCKVPIMFQGVVVEADPYALPLVGPDVVLGVQWLEGLRRVTTDYRTRVMEFKSGGKRVTLKAGEEKITKEVGLK
ncbi:Unknown protein, partial [Striga hermonthica]